MEIYDFGHKAFEQVVDRVNEGAVQGFDDHDSEFLAASYAVSGEDFEGAEAGSAYNDNDIEKINANLDYLAQGGAKFDYSKAQDKALELIKKH